MCKGHDQQVPLIIKQYYRTPIVCGKKNIETEKRRTEDKTIVATNDIKDIDDTLDNDDDRMSCDL